MLYPMYFQPLSPEQANPMLYGLQQGTQIVGQGQENIGRGLQNQLMAAQVPYAGQMAQANLATSLAQAPYIQSQTDLNYGTLPYLGMKFYGPMMMAQARMMQAGISNSNSFKDWTQTPEGAAFVANNPQMAGTIAQAMQNSAGMINSGLPGMGNYNNPASYPALPGSTPNIQGTPITPDQVSQLKNMVQPSVPISNIQDAAGLAAIKKTTDATVRQKNLYASNIDKTLDNINVNDLTQFSGIPGIAELKRQQTLASVGKESSAYDNYMTSLNAANMLATQVRQFYGDSIQPSMIQRLERLTNPTTWSVNPALAQALFNQTKQILNQETGTYRQAVQSMAPYVGQGTQQTTQTPTISGNNARVSVVSPNGKRGTIPSSQLQAALEAGFKQG